jgi:hypothetical protein
MVVDERRMLRTIQVIAWYVRAGGPRGLRATTRNQTEDYNCCYQHQVAAKPVDIRHTTSHV